MPGIDKTCIIAWGREEDLLSTLTTSVHPEVTKKQSHEDSTVLMKAGVLCRGVSIH